MRTSTPIYPLHSFSQVPIAYYDINTGKQTTPFLLIEANYLTHIVKEYQGIKYLVCLNIQNPIIDTGSEPGSKLMFIHCP